MEHIVLAEIREAKNKKNNKQIRVDGDIPAVVYGNGKEPIAIKINQRAFRKQFSHVSESTLITLKIAGGEDKTVLIKDFTQNLIRKTIEHIDFYEISKGKSLTTKVIIHIHGTPEGNKKGGITEHSLHEVEIECLPKDLPEIIEVDISHLDIGMSIYVRDLPSMAGITYKSSDEQLVVQISPPKQVSLVPDTEEDIEEEESEE